MASAPSPATTSAEASSAAVSPPSYSSTPVQPAAKSDSKADGKIAHEKPIPEEGIEPVKQYNEDDLPEVVPEGHIPPEKKKDWTHQGSAEQEKSALGGTDEKTHGVPMDYSQTPPPAFHQHTASYHSGQRMSMPLDHMFPSSGSIAANEAATVTPLHLLADQSDTVDCPFCLRRCETRVKKGASWLTHSVAAGLFFTTFCGVLAPYMLHWAPHVSHWCQNCDRKVAYRNYGTKEMTPLGTPEHLRAVSRFPAAEPPTVVVSQEQQV